MQPMKQLQVGGKTLGLILVTIPMTIMMMMLMMMMIIMTITIATKMVIMLMMKGWRLSMGALRLIHHSSRSDTTKGQLKLPIV